MKFLAQLGAKSTNQALERAPEERRYPILVAFLWHAHEEITDEAIEMFDAMLADFYRRAGNDLHMLRKDAARATNELVRHFDSIGRMLLDPGIPDDRLREMIRRYLPDERLREKLEVSERLVRPLDDNYFDLLAQRYTYIRSFSPRLLSSFVFRSNLRHDPLLDAVDLLRRLDGYGKRKVPWGAPLDFVGPKWRPYVVDDESRIDRRYYEMCVLWELRGALRSGDVWVEGSRRYADPESYLIPRERWSSRAGGASRGVAPDSDGDRPESGSGPWIIFFGVAIDQFSDGVMIGTGSSVGLTLGLLLALGQVPADIPEGFAMGANFRGAGVARRTRLLLSAPFAVPILLGATISYFTLRGQPELYKLMLLTFTAGVLTTLVVEELVPEAHEEAADIRLAPLVFAAGFALFALISAYFEIE